MEPAPLESSPSPVAVKSRTVEDFQVVAKDCYRRLEIFLAVLVVGIHADFAVLTADKLVEFAVFAVDCNIPVVLLPVAAAEPSYIQRLMDTLFLVLLLMPFLE